MNKTHLLNWIMHNIQEGDVVLIKRGRFSMGKNDPVIIKKKMIID